MLAISVLNEGFYCVSMERADEIGRNSTWLMNALHSMNSGAISDFEYQNAVY